MSREARRMEMIKEPKWGVKAALALTEGPVELPGAAWLRMIPGVELVVVDGGDIGDLKWTQNF